MKRKLICVAFAFAYSATFAQTDPAPSSPDTIIQTQKEVVTSKKRNSQTSQVYTLKPAVDVPIVIVGTAWSLYAFTKIYKKGNISEQTIMNLKKEDVNKFDRWGMYPYSKSLDDVSYYPFYASMPLPFIFFLTGERTRK